MTHSFVFQSRLAHYGIAKQVLLCALQSLTIKMLD